MGRRSTLGTAQVEIPIGPARAAAILGVATTTLRTWRWRGIGPPYRKLTKQTVIYLESEVLAWRERGRVDPIDGPRVPWEESEDGQEA